MKYPRTYHLPYSPGATKDDKKLKEDWFDYFEGEEIVITEKLDGSNTSMSAFGVCERSTGQETRSPWSRNLWDNDGLYWKVKPLLQDDEIIFGENLYGEHSIHYDKLPAYWYMFAEYDEVSKRWASWDFVKYWAKILNVPTVPELWRGVVSDENSLKTLVNYYTKEPSVYGDTREGVVIRVTKAFSGEDFSHNVCKWVRKDHVNTDEHWTKNWKKAELNPLYVF